MQLIAEREILGFQLDVDLERVVAVGQLVSGQFWTLPLAEILAWPFDPRMLLKTQWSGCISSRPVRLRIGYGSPSQVISHRSLRSISASIAIRPSGRCRSAGSGSRDTRRGP